MQYKSLFLALVMAAFAINSHAQESLSEVIEQEELGWLLGKWKASTDEGPLTTTFSWALDKTVIMTETTNPRWKTKGITGLDPDSGEVRYNGYSTTGSALRGVWDVVDGKLVLSIKVDLKDGDTMKVGLRYSKTSGGNLKLEMHELDDDGGFVEPAQWEKEYTKVKKKKKIQKNAK